MGVGEEASFGAPQPSAAAPSLAIPQGGSSDRNNSNDGSGSASGSGTSAVSKPKDTTTLMAVLGLIATKELKSSEPSREIQAK